MTAGSIPASEFFPLLEAARYFPRPGGRKISVKTLYRWASRGMRRGKLRTIRLGQQVCTCEDWVRAFISALNLDDVEVGNGVRPSDSEESRRRAVEHELDAAGIA